jgi:quinol monooxygenase YgiN
MDRAIGHGVILPVFRVAARVFGLRVASGYRARPHSCPEVQMSNVAVIAKITCKEGMRDDALALFIGHVEFVNSEVGTLIYALNVDSKDDVTIWFYELYTDAAALAVHGGGDAMKAMGPKLAPFLAGRPEIHVLNPIVAKGL